MNNINENLIEEIDINDKLDDESIDSKYRYLSSISNNDTDDCLKKSIEMIDLSLFKGKNELNKFQLQRIDEIENSIFDLLKIMTCNDNLDWNMEIIGRIGDYISDILTAKGYLIYYPAIYTEDDETESICNFHPI